MTTYDAYYCTIAQAKVEGGDVTPSATTNDAKWLEAIGKMSVWAQGYCGVSFEPILRTVYYDVDALTDAQTLDLKARLLAVSSITLADGTVLETTDYQLFPRGQTPSTNIYLSNASGYEWTQYTDDLKQSIAITGYWGHRSNYGVAWSQATTLNGTIANATATSVTVTDASNLWVGALIRIESEYLRVTAISTNTLTVVRGVHGTTAAAHSTSTAVYEYQPDFMLSDAVARGVGWIYKRFGTFEEVTFDQTGLININKAKLPPDVLNRLNAYKSARVVASRKFAAP